MARKKPLNETKTVDDLIAQDKALEREADAARGAPEKAFAVTAQVLLVPIADLLPNPENARMPDPETPDAQDLAELADDLKRNGQLVPVEFRIVGGKRILIDGNRRLAAAKLAGLSHLEAVERLGITDLGAFEKTMGANRNRKPMTPLELAAEVKTYLKKHGGNAFQHTRYAIGCKRAPIFRIHIKNTNANDQ